MGTALGQDFEYHQGAPHGHNCPGHYTYALWQCIFLELVYKCIVCDSVCKHHISDEILPTLAIVVLICTMKQTSVWAYTLRSGFVVIEWATFLVSDSLPKLGSAVQVNICTVRQYSLELMCQDFYFFIGLCSWVCWPFSWLPVQTSEFWWMPALALTVQWYRCFVRLHTLELICQGFLLFICCGVLLSVCAIFLASCAGIKLQWYLPALALVVQRYTYAL